MDEQNEQTTANEQRQSAARLRPREALVGFIDSEPVLKYGKTGIPRFYARVGVDHYRPDGEDSFVKTGTTFHDLVIFRKTAERAKELFAVDDRFIAQGYVREFTDQRGNEREEFVAKKIGHDPMWTPYTVNRDPEPEAVQREAPGLDRSQAFEQERPAQQREPAVLGQ
ncbi:single-stranded DNA-binding protein [Enemella evansiae]|uniref:Single-stranded DNA-binding protein n=1 Tax=Enemella evansiae TaxID=2016499 RepID=A0A255FYR3_9ACTN|nr:single-stranded DNA-binding protein [Enemella evansiae]OYO08830.1 single-stranded DNA-binding protein [Enemella evansiae]